jgi:hypothetical protein
MLLRMPVAPKAKSIWPVEFADDWSRIRADLELRLRRLRDAVQHTKVSTNKTEARLDRLVSIHHIHHVYSVVCLAIGEHELGL